MVPMIIDLVLPSMKTKVLSIIYYDDKYVSTYTNVILENKE